MGSVDRQETHVLERATSSFLPGKSCEVLQKLVQASAFVVAIAETAAINQAQQPLQQAYLDRRLVAVIDEPRQSPLPGVLEHQGFASS